MKDTLEAITKISGVQFRPASDQDLSALRNLGVPAAVLSFYSEHEPSDAVEGVVRLWPVSHILLENTELMPGCAMAPHGFFVFSSTFCGDAYAFDSNAADEHGSPRIVLISHEVLEEDSTREFIASKAKQVALNIGEFLDQFAEGEIDEECIY